MKYIKAKPISYGGKRSKKEVIGIVFHYTGNKGDTALGNASYFHRSGDGNTRSAGAHFFIDQKGNVVKSIAMNLTAWSVGDYEGTETDRAPLHGILRNSNTVSIELCDIATKDPSAAMIKTVKRTLKYIRKHCKNAIIVCRHWDITGKDCPGRMTGRNNPRWVKFLKDIGELNHARPRIGSKKTAHKEHEAPKDLFPLTIDGKWGTKTTIASQKYFGTIADGIVSRQRSADKSHLPAAVDGVWRFMPTKYQGGSGMIKALQKTLGFKEKNRNGHMTSKTVKALQKYLDLKPTGKLDSQTVKAWQRYLNAHKPK